MKKPIQFGKYWLLDRVNVGGMAEVWKAKAFGVEGFERLLAVKRILPNIAEDEEFITMFIDEAKIAVQLNHANVCQIFDLGKVDDSYFIALEFVHGKDLRALFDRCKQKPVDGAPAMPIAQACFVVMKACEGLDYAHNKRDVNGKELHLVHRDVSPQNVLISYEGEVKLIDFGIAKAAGKASKTQQGILKGKFGYMSPEQVRGLPLDRRSDIFSLGIVLYELLTGERLFIGESDFSTLEKVRNVEILPPSTYNRRIGEELERIVMKALAKDVDDRYQNAIDLHDDLQAFMYTAGEFYSRKDLAAWMKRVFVKEIEEESAKLEQYRHMPVPPVPPGVQQPMPGLPAGAPGAPPERPRRNSGPIAVTPPPPPVPQRITGQHAAVPPPPPAPPGKRNSGQIPVVSPVAAAPAAPAAPAAGAAVPAAAAPAHAPGTNGAVAKANGAGGELAWDDEELATNIYDAPPEEEGGEAEVAADSIVDDKPDLSKVALNPDGKPVPHHSVVSKLPAPPDPPPPAWPATPDDDALAPAPPRNGTARRHNPFAPVGVGFGESMPHTPTPAVPAMTDTPGLQLRRRGKPAGFYAGAGLLALAACASIVAAVVYFNSRPGSLKIDSDPSTNVQILIDNKRQAVEGTPATLGLEPGVYMLTVQREGYVPATEQVEIKSGEETRRKVTLEPLASGTGFTLVSEPAGAQALLDGRALEGMTPLKVQSVMPGKHKIEVRWPTGKWAQDVTIDAGKMLDVRAVLAPEAPAKGAPAKAVAAAPTPPAKAPAPPAKAPAPTPAPSPPPVTKPAVAAAKPAPAPTTKTDKETPVAKAKEPEPAREKPAAASAAANDKATPKKKPAAAAAAPSTTLPDEEAPAKHVGSDKPAVASGGGGEGYLRLGSKPWTNITVDGKDTGLHTPQTRLKLGAGSHKITLTNPQFNINESFSVQIKSGETETVIKDLRSQGGDSND